MEVPENYLSTLLETLGFIVSSSGYIVVVFMPVIIVTLYIVFAILTKKQDQ